MVIQMSVTPKCKIWVKQESFWGNDRIKDKDHGARYKYQGKGEGNQDDLGGQYV